MKVTRVVLVISGLLAAGLGLALMFATQGFLAQQGITADDKVLVIGQAQGSLLVGLGIMNFLALRCSDVRGLQAVLGGNLAVQLTALVVNFRALSSGAVNASVWGDVGGHVVLLLAFVGCLVLVGRQPAKA